MANSEFNIQDYWDFYCHDDISAEDEAAISAAMIDDLETSSIQLDSRPSSIQDHDSIACGICMETKSLAEFYDTKFCCTHLYCNECVGSYVADKIQDGIGWINCPEPGTLPQRLIERWGDLVCEAMIQA